MAHKRCLVAIVDDDELVCKAIARVVAAMDANVATFVSGRMFLDSLLVRRPDCVVLDLHMPELSGTDVLRALADSRWDLPVIVVTGRDDPASRDSCLALGAIAYLTKPLAHEELMRTINEAVSENTNRA
jgi:FixJ family two-component response regulator